RNDAEDTSGLSVAEGFDTFLLEENDMALSSINPATGEKMKDYPEMTAGEVAGIVDRVDEAFDEWRREPRAKRADALLRLGAGLTKDLDNLAELMAREMGKPIQQGKAEVGKCIRVCEFYAEKGPAFLQP